MTRSWIPQPGDDKVQEAAATYASIGYNPNRLTELTIAQLSSMMEGVGIVLNRVVDQLSLKVVKMFSDTQKDPDNIQLFFEAVEALLSEKPVLRELRQYSQGTQS